MQEFWNQMHEFLKLMQEFFSMSGYAPFVWPAYAIALGALLWYAWQARRQLDNAREEARRKVAMRGDNT